MGMGRPLESNTCPSHKNEAAVTKTVRVLDHGDFLEVSFSDQSYTFHAQWLFDARCEKVLSRSASSAFCMTPPNAKIVAAELAGCCESELRVHWADDTASFFPILWLHVMAPWVASVPRKPESFHGELTQKGWLVSDLKIPTISYLKSFDASIAAENTIAIMNLLLRDSEPGIVKIVDLPQPCVEDEQGGVNTIVTSILKKIFSEVFVHPRRGKDKTFNIASHHAEGMRRATTLTNYDTSAVLLPHVDHAHYTHSAQIQGLYCLEGESINTFVSSLAVLDTMKKECPDLYESLQESPMSVGRVAHYYEPPLYQQTVDTPVTFFPGSQKVKRVRWHPHLTGCLLVPHERFVRSRRAHQMFQEIARRKTHQLELVFKPGDLYIWNNFITMHGREKVLTVPRTSAGQTVSEQIVEGRYRDLLVPRLKAFLGESWLIHLSNAQLDMLAVLVGLVE